jgi:uncharacterized protein GlcG (DUF336 family)
MMDRKHFGSLLVICVLLISAPSRAQEALVTYKSLTPEIALDLARAALADCQKRGYQVAVAIVDRFGVPQVMLRDRYAGPHTPATATGKAWTAATFRNSTSNLFTISQPGMMQAGIRNLPGAVIIGGGLVVESGGSLVGAIGVSGAPRGRCRRSLRQGSYRGDSIQARFLGVGSCPAGNWLAMMVWTASLKRHLVPKRGRRSATEGSRP